MRWLSPAVLCLALGASSLAAQPTTLDVSMVDILFDDRDNSGDVTCGDEINYIVTMGGNDPGIDPQDVELRIPYDSNATLVPGSVIPSNPNDAVTILDGLDPGDTQLRIDFGTICNAVNRCTQIGAGLTFQVRINAPNPATQILHQATVTGSNFPTTLSDDLNSVGANDATRTTFPACSGGPPPPSGPFVRAFKTWALTTDQDSDGVVDEGDTVRYTVTVRNTIPGDAAAFGLVFDSGVDSSSTLVAGSVTTNRGTVVQGNSAGDSRVRVQIGTMALNATDTTIRFDVVVRNPVPASVSNLVCQGTVTGSNLAADVLTDDPFTAASPDPTYTPLDFDPDLAVAKNDGGAQAVPGVSVVYTITAQNLSTRSRADNVVLTETVPAASSFNAGASSPGWTCAGSSCTLFIATLPPGASTTRTFAVRPADPFPAGVSQLLNTVRISDGGENGPDRNLANNQATDTTPLDPAAARPDLSIEKTDGGASVRPGETVVYQLTYSNSGNRGATGVVVTETVPAGTTFSAASSSPGWSCSPGVAAGASCTRSLGGFAGGGAAGSLSFAVTVNPTLPVGFTVVQNTASIADDGANGPDANPADNTASDTTPVTGLAPDLRVVKENPLTPSAGPGDVLVWTLSYSNAGNQDAASVVLEESVPDGTTFEPPASTAGWTCSPSASAGSTCTLAVGTVAAGSSGSAQFAARILPALPPGISAIENCARARSGSVVGEGCTIFPLPSAAPDLEVTKTDLDITAEPGDDVAYRVIVRNLGNQGATGVVLTETVPAHTSFVGLFSPGWFCPDSTGPGTVCKLNVGTLLAGETRHHTFTVRLDSPIPAGVLQIANVVSVADDGTNGPEPDTANNMASDTTPIEGAGPGPGTGPLLTATKQDALRVDGQVVGEANPGDTVVYTVVISNLGDAAALDTVFLSGTDPHTALLPGSVTVSKTGASVLVGNGTGDTSVRVALGTLAPTESVILTFEVILDADLPADLTEIACQGRVLASNVSTPAPTPSDPPGTVLTDDPDTPEPDDPTVTPVANRPDGIVEVPTLSEIGLLLLTLSLAGFAVFRIRRAPAPFALPGGRG